MAGACLNFALGAREHIYCSAGIYVPPNKQRRNSRCFDEKGVSMFIPCSEKQGSAYFEFQYCKKNWNIKKLLKKGYSWGEKDSLLVHVDYDKDFTKVFPPSLRVSWTITNARS